MDPLSIAGTCVGLAATIARTTVEVSQFMRNVRDARSEMDAIARELGSLATVLDILADDAKTASKIPDSLEKQVLGIASNCSDVVVQLETTLKKYDGERLKTRVKWTFSGKDDMDKYKSTLAAHKSALDLALELLTL